MNALIGVLIAATLSVGSGCAKTDWIERTLVTVGVKGTWQGRIAGVGFQPEVFLESKEAGSGLAS
jgi:hypothetical protein